METPYTQHLTAEDFEHVYEPAEDSFLLLDALEMDLKFLQEELQPGVCVEIGSGSGVIITALSKKLSANALCLATDINPRACKATQSTALHNQAQVDCLRCNLADGLRKQAVDLLIFNPPYVVTSEAELTDSKESSSLVYAWAGGTDGRGVTDRLLQQLDDILSPRGALYLLLLRENKPEEIITYLANLSFKAIKLMERRIPGEYLYILKVTRSSG